MGWIAGSFFLLTLMLLWNDSTHEVKMKSLMYHSMQDSVKHSVSNVASRVASNIRKSLQFTNQDSFTVLYRDLPTFSPYISPNQTGNGTLSIDQSTKFYESNIKNYRDGDDDDNDEGNHKLYIYLDWHYDYRLFNEYNYKSLESLLTIYPNASFQIFIPHLNYYHSITDSRFNPSISFFQMYTQKGYKIQMISKSFLCSNKINKFMKSYYIQYIQPYCMMINNHHDPQSHHSQYHQQVPYHMITFLRLTELYNSGGIYMEPSYFFLGSLSKAIIRQVYYHIIIY
jgi:hypothetical protein